MKFCSECGATVHLGIPLDDNRERYICEACHHIHYQNPQIIAGCLPLWENGSGSPQVLLCKRAIEPRKGLWTLPAGYLENGESVEEGALRETEEEANAEVDIIRLFTVSSIPQINQIYMIYLGNLKNTDFFPGDESLEVQLFKEDEIDWKTLAFSAVKFALQSYFQNKKSEQVYSNTISFNRL